MVPAVTCPLRAQVWESRALKEKVTSVVVKSAQVTSRVPVPWVKVQEFEFEDLLGVNIQVKFPDAGTVAHVVVPGHRSPDVRRATCRTGKTRPRSRLSRY